MSTRGALCGIIISSYTTGWTLRKPKKKRPNTKKLTRHAGDNFIKKPLVKNLNQTYALFSRMSTPKKGDRPILKKIGLSPFLEYTGKQDSDHERADFSLLDRKSTR
ncbi:MAG: hypothetical protein KGY42_07395, partial [Desulfobacterales bacterium]|nr:hypothetical protein [Desulfobacterales bacterium]